MDNSLKTPKELVAEVLKINVDMVNDNSAYGETPNWDSLYHIDLIYALEANYGIRIDNADIEKYTTIAAITELFNRIKEGI